ncbi:hypothetical protein H6F78_07380 [Coleofasciculus sp. FACHB-64]|nr:MULTISPECIES: hypothetical protein [unclassified Coleofasciculus]MBD1838480.1 hypothetical protein [Coleofasciculus sp. FACHB-501]MBD2045420.1 hypothetical protein [Coleofasciculus sp. FACHB-64]
MQKSLGTPPPTSPRKRGNRGSLWGLGAGSRSRRRSRGGVLLLRVINQS